MENVEFNIGDTVKRINKSCFNHKIGDINVIKQITDNGSLIFDDNCVYDEKYYVLVKTSKQIVYAVY